MWMKRKESILRECGSNGMKDANARINECSVEERVRKRIVEGEHECTGLNERRRTVNE